VQQPPDPLTANVNPPPRRWRGLVYGMTAVVALLGAAGIAGWIFGIPALKSILPGAVQMKINTSILLALSASALMLLCNQSRAILPGIALLLAVVVAAVGAARVPVGMAARHR
jgi:hypothetical protein